MTAQEKLRWLILCARARLTETAPPPWPCPDVDERYRAAVDERYRAADAREEFDNAVCEVRASGVPTGLSTPPGGHYEPMAVAAPLPDGSWVGWTYWYGGGKHGSPHRVPWIENAYDVASHEETRVVRVFEIAGTTR